MIILADQNHVIIAIYCPTLPQALLNEISGHESSIDNVKSQGQELIDNNHFASDDIQQQLLELQSRWRELKLLADRRTQKLKDSQEAQKVI